jgi:hypothetical protein
MVLLLLAQKLTLRVVTTLIEIELLWSQYLTPHICLSIITPTRHAICMFKSLSFHNSYLLQINLALFMTLQPLHPLWLPQLCIPIHNSSLWLPPIVRIDLFPLILRRRIRAVINHWLAIKPIKIDLLVCILLFTGRGISIIAWGGLSTYIFLIVNIIFCGFRQFNEFLGEIGF